MSTITPIVATVESVADGATQCSNPGPMMMPAISSPMTAGCLSRSKTSPMNLPAAKTTSRLSRTLDVSVAIVLVLVRVRVPVRYPARVSGLLPAAKHRAADVRGPDMQVSRAFLADETRRTCAPPTVHLRQVSTSPPREMRTSRESPSNDVRRLVPPEMARRRGPAPFKEVWALKTLVTRFFDPSAITGQWPRILKRSAVRTAIFTIVALVLLTGLAVAGDPNGAATGDINAVTAATAGQPTAAELGAAARSPDHRRQHVLRDHGRRADLLHAGGLHAR